MNAYDAALWSDRYSSSDEEEEIPYKYPQNTSLNINSKEATTGCKEKAISQTGQ